MKQMTQCESLRNKVSGKIQNTVTVEQARQVTIQELDPVFLALFVANQMQCWIKVVNRKFQ
jgi:hypothetical protein